MTLALKTLVLRAVFRLAALVLSTNERSIPLKNVVIELASVTLNRSAISVITNRVREVPSVKTQSTRRARVSTVGTWQRTV